MTSPETRQPNPTRWIGPVLCCAAFDPDAYEGVCGIPVESEPCAKHGTHVPPDIPLTCQWCRNQAAAQLVVVDWPVAGRHMSLVCDQCGDMTPQDVGTAALLFRYQLVPIEEKADA